MLPRFIKLFPHEFKRVLGVSRSRKVEIPNRPVAPIAHVQHAPLAQVQNG
jgi:hypothetical protein